MQRLILILITVCSFHMACSQEVTYVKKERLRNFYIAPAVGLEFFSFNNYVTDYNGYAIKYNPQTSVRLGFDLAYKYNQKFSVNTGLFFATKNYDRVETCEECTKDYFYQSNYTNSYIETLLGANYNFVSGRLDVGLYSNVNFAFLMKSQEKRETETGNSFIFNTKPAATKWLTIIEPGISFNYNLNYRLSLGLKTGYRLYANSIEYKKTFKNNAVVLQPGLYYMF